MFARFVAFACVVLLNPVAHAETAMRLKDFEGIEEPEVKYIAATGKFERDAFINITNAGITPQLPVGESWVEHRDASTRKL